MKRIKKGKLYKKHNKDSSSEESSSEGDAVLRTTVPKYAHKFNVKVCR